MAAARRAPGDWSRRRWPGAGWSLVEVCAALALAGMTTSMAAPALARAARREKLSGALRSVAADLTAARWRALASGATVGLRLVRQPQGDLFWTMHLDGDGDGLRSADMAAGVDPVLAAAVRLSRLFPGIRSGVPPDRPVPRLPPQSGPLDNPGDPIKFGPGDLLSFSPLGSCTPGSLYLTDGEECAALVVNGTTGRLRLFRLAASSSRWKEMS